MNFTFKEVAEIWYKERIVPTSAPKTIKCYRTWLDTRIYPAFGDMFVTDIKVMHIDKFVSELREGTTNYNGRTNTPLAKSSVQKFFNIVRSVMGYAYDNELIPRNPCSRTKVTFREEVNEDKCEGFWDIKTYNKVLELLKHEEIGKALAVEFALKTGLRRSEQWGLTWKDVDLEACKITVNKSRQKVDGQMTVMPCKTKSSVRTISISKSLRDALKKYKQIVPNTIYIFQDLNYDSITSWFRTWQPKHNVPRIRWHDLRHTHATLLLFQGIDLKTISKRLGHSDIAMTMNTYAHVISELDVEAAEAIENI